MGAELTLDAVEELRLTDLRQLGQAFVNADDPHGRLAAPDLHTLCCDTEPWIPA